MSCTKTQRNLCGECKICLDRSFASHEKAHCWSLKNKLDARFVCKGSSANFWFNCDCGHEFSMMMSNVNKGKWCPYCKGSSVCGNEKCKCCFDRSFASNPKSVFWSDNNEDLPLNVTKSSGKEYLFDCIDCGHEFKIRISKVNIGRWCHYCSNKILCSDEQCTSCYEKSFASDERSKFWCKKNKFLPRHIYKTSGKKYKFVCDKKHSFESRMADITFNNQWCPFCVNKTEGVLKEFLEKKYEISTQNKFEWCINSETNKQLPFDFYIPEKNVLIELDGAQHFRQVSNWKDPDSTRYIDVFKMKQALNNGLRIIRLLQEDVANVKLSRIWQKRLIEAIDSDDLVTYITCKEKDKDIYECHQEELEYELKET